MVVCYSSKFSCIMVQQAWWCSPTQRPLQAVCNRHVSAALPLKCSNSGATDRIKRDKWILNKEKSAPMRKEQQSCKKTWRKIGRVTWNLGLHIAHKPLQSVMRALGGWEHSGGAQMLGSCWRTSQLAPWFGPHQELERIWTEFQAELLV